MDAAKKLRETRLAIGASNREMAELIGLAGANANDRVIELEDGRRPVSGPIERVLDYLAQGAALAGGDAANAIVSQYVPEFVELNSPAVGEGSDDFEAYMHTRYPRFIAVFSELLPPELQERLAEVDLERLPMQGDSGLGEMIAIPVDRILSRSELHSAMVRLAHLVPGA